MSKTKNMLNFFLILGLISAILVAFSLFGYRHYLAKLKAEADTNAQKDRTDIKEEISEGNTKVIDEIKKQDSSFVDLKKGQNDLKKEIKSSIKKNTPKIDVKDSPNTVIQINENGDNVINQPTEKYKPKIEFLDKSVEKIKDSSSVLFKTKFIFGSKDGFPLTNPEIDITFNNIFEKITGGVTGTGMVSAGNLQKKIKNNNTGYIITTNILQAGNYFFIETISKFELEILELKVKP